VSNLVWWLKAVNFVFTVNFLELPDGLQAKQNNIKVPRKSDLIFIDYNYLIILF
jgi:hypothetical protein